MHLIWNKSRPKWQAARRSPWYSEWWNRIMETSCEFRFVGIDVLLTWLVVWVFCACPMLDLIPWYFTLWNEIMETSRVGTNHKTWEAARIVLWYFELWNEIMKTSCESGAVITMQCSMHLCGNTSKQKWEAARIIPWYFEWWNGVMKTSCESRSFVVLTFYSHLWFCGFFAPVLIV